MKRIGAAGAGLLGLLIAASPSFAADIPARMPTKAPAVVAPGYSWHGFYIGAHAGYAWGDDTLSLTGLPVLPATIAPAFSFDRNGAIAGLQWGTNYQFGRWVLGTESDISFIDFDESQTLVFGGATNIATQEMEYFSTTRGRVGYAFDNVLLYGTAGLASARIETTYLETTTGFAGTRSKNRYGWTAGAGWRSRKARNCSSLACNTGTRPAARSACSAATNSCSVGSSSASTRCKALPSKNTVTRRSCGSWPWRLKVKT